MKWSTKQDRKRSTKGVRSHNLLGELKDMIDHEGKINQPYR